MNILLSIWDSFKKQTGGSTGAIVAIIVTILLMYFSTTWAAERAKAKEAARWEAYVGEINTKHAETLKAERDLRIAHEQTILSVLEKNEELSKGFDAAYYDYMKNVEELIAMENNLDELSSTNKELLRQIQTARCDVQMVDPAFHRLVNDRLQFIRKD